MKRSNLVDPGQQDLSLPSRERELKLLNFTSSAGIMMSLPSRERELKLPLPHPPAVRPASLPSRERELKQTIAECVSIG